MRTSETIAKLAEALSKAQGAIEDAKKDKENPHFGSKYADLAAVRAVVRAPLADNGLSVVQVPVRTDAGIVIETRLLHASGEWIEGELPLTVQGNTMQNMVSAITYARRASLAAMTGVAPAEDDDDGQGAATPAPRQRQQQAAKPREPQQRPQAEPKPATPGVISDAQRTRLWARAKEVGWTKPDVEKLLALYHFDSSRKITVDKYDAIVTAIETGSVPDDSAQEGATDAS